MSYCQWYRCRIAFDSYYFYKVKLKLSSLLEGLWSPKLDRHNSWARSPGDTPPWELVMSSRWGHITFEKYLPICTFECMSIWDVSICQSHVTK